MTQELLSVGIDIGTSPPGRAVCALGTRPSESLRRK